MGSALAGVGDPQIKSDHPWYPGELAISTFERLFATQAEVYERVTGEKPTTDEQKALAAWLWRNTHFAHGEEGNENLFDGKFDLQDNSTRDYWTGLFSHGFALCGTTHGQWCAEMNALLGHGRGRCVGVAGHNSFEVFLTGGPYGEGRWALLDHDISTVIFSENGDRLLSIPEIKADLGKLTDPTYKPQRQRGWLVSGLHPGDAKGVYGNYTTAEYLAGYAGPSPMVHLRRGEKMRRYFAPGLEDGKTFVFWGRNYNTAGIPGPERPRTWVNQPEKMFGAKSDTGHKDGQARYGNVVFTYEPNFSNNDFREAMILEKKGVVTFEHRSPYLIGATPPDNEPWGIYEPGCKNGLIVEGQGVKVAVSVDQGGTWSPTKELTGKLDLTDGVKGHRGFWLRVEHNDEAMLARSGLRWTVVCQCNSSVLPRLKDGGTEITYAASNEALVSAGPSLAHARQNAIEGPLGQAKSATLKLAAHHGEPISHVYAAAHMASSNPPDPKVKYQIEYSADDGQTWSSLVKDWSIPRRGEEPRDFWSQSFVWGDTKVESEPANLWVRFTNDGGKLIRRAEAHATYRLKHQDKVQVTYAWSEAGKASREASHVFAASDKEQQWQIETGQGVVTKWVDMSPMP